MTREIIRQSTGLTDQEISDFLDQGFLVEDNDGRIDDDLVSRLGVVQFLLQIGLTNQAIRSILAGNGQSELRKARVSLLHSIHERQRVLDQLDWLIRSEQNRTKG